MSVFVVGVIRFIAPFQNIIHTDSGAVTAYDVLRVYKTCIKITEVDLMIMICSYKALNEKTICLPATPRIIQVTRPFEYQTSTRIEAR